MTHAMFLEPPDLVRDRTWDALVLSGIDAARLAARAAAGGAEATLRRSRTSPFAASARRENARRHDRGRVVYCSGERKKRLLVRAQRSSPYWRACRTEFEFARFAEAFEFVRYAPGEHIVRAGDVADFALLLVEGGARLETNNAFQQCEQSANDVTFGPGAVLGEMALFLAGGRRSAGATAFFSDTDSPLSDFSESGSESGASESETESETASEPVSDDGVLTGGVHPGVAGADGSETRRLAKTFDPTRRFHDEAKTRRKRHTYAVRVYFDAFVDFFAAHPALATRAFGAFANAAAIRLDQWRLLAAASSSQDADISRGGGRPAKTNGGRPPKPSKKANAANAANAVSETRFVREGFGVVPFARAWSEDARAAVARVARLVEARPGKAMFPAGACASAFGVLLAGSTSEDVEEDAPREGEGAKAAAFPGSVVGAGAFAAALFRPAARATAVVAGARGASVAVFDAAALETLDTARPGLGLELAARRRAPARARRRRRRTQPARTRLSRTTTTRRVTESGFLRMRSSRNRPRRRCASRLPSRGRGEATRRRSRRTTPRR